MEYQRGCCWPDVRRLNAYKLGIYQLPSWSGAWRDLFHERSQLARGATHKLAYPPYNYMAANEMQGIISGDSSGLMLVGLTPLSFV